jgi:hypothetical protein
MRPPVEVLVNLGKLELDQRARFLIGKTMSEAGSLFAVYSKVHSR